ncbi:hypothetical protein HHSLTHF2_10060 [Vreelandella venusta]|jgi:ABC-type antimicrobial peptide transport system permease subunit|uniref:Uncharacterized protein n=1 Tax=Halomonas hydrothermalis TaxID=115561 RepID=A0A6F8U1V5_9GAMM|nr:hypothetical protein [Halomonas hydrothermalis]BCB07116.1 hypothetical protein HHSLTHF2_10060 [Halomonas hydrothermalis]
MDKFEVKRTIEPAYCWGLATINLAYLIYIHALLDFDVGLASMRGARVHAP